MTSRPWRGGPELRDTLAEHAQRALAAVARVPQDELLRENAELLCERLCVEHLPTEIFVRWDKLERSEIRESKRRVASQFPGEVPAHRDIDVHEVGVTVRIEGPGDFLLKSATVASPMPLEGRILPGFLSLEVVGNPLTGEIFDAALSRWRTDIDKRVSWANEDIRAHRKETARRVSMAIQKRREMVLQANELEASLNVPVRQRPHRERVPVAVTRKVVKVETRRKQAGFVPEPILDQATYDDVVAVCRSWGRGYERSPVVANKFGEEDLRDNLLITLNSHWEGGAGAEMFNGTGKTDILVRANDRNIFIGECKIWHGRKKAAEALDQLLGYMVWRDSKGALIFFIRNARPAEAIEQLHAAIAEHPKVRLTKPDGIPAERVDYVVEADEEGRTIDVAVLPVVITDPAKRSG